MSHSTAASVGGSLGRPLYQRKVIANPAGLADGADAASGSAASVSASSGSAASVSASSGSAASAASTPAAQVTIHSAAPQGRTQVLTQQLDEKLTSSLTRIRQKIGNGSTSAGVSLDISA